MRVIIEPHTIGVFPYVKSLAKYTTVRKSPALGKFYTQTQNITMKSD